jgi:hypothetical protein
MKRTVGISLVVLLVVMLVAMLSAGQAWAVSSVDGWSRTYGGTNDDKAYALVQTGDGGFAIAGSTDSFGAGGYDFWLVKTDASGNMQWNKTYGGTGDDEAYALVQTGDGGYALAGYTESFGAGHYDFWLVKTDAGGLVPEFPSALILAISVAVTSLTVILTKRKSQRSRKDSVNTFR